jgi:hypothetical protein
MVNNKSLLKHKSLFKTNSEVHIISTRDNTNFFQPLTCLKICQKGPYHSGIKVFKSLRPEIRNLSSDEKQFKMVLKKFLLAQALYTLEEYLNYKLGNIIT